MSRRGGHHLVDNNASPGQAVELPSEQPSIFNWGTLQEIGPEVLPYQNPVPGKRYEVKLITGETIPVWRAADGQQYFCHGLTFGGKEAPGGPISPFSGEPVETILLAQYERVPDEVQARPGDILVWRGVPGSLEGTTPHSAILTAAVAASGQDRLDDGATRAQTKNGIMPETNMSLTELFAMYGETYMVYRRRKPAGSPDRE